MADEKVIRISAQDTGFGQQINRMAEDAKKALSNIGLDSLFDDADKQFDKIEDKIRAIGEELKRKSKEANDAFSARKEGGNDAFKRNVEREQENYNARSEEAIKKFDQFSQKLQEKLNTTGGGDGGSGGGGIVSASEGMSSKSIMAEMLGGAAVIGIVAAVAGALKSLYGMGMDDWRTESKVSANFDINRDTFGRMGRGGEGRASDFGMDNVDYKQFILEVAKGRGSASNIEDIAYRQMAMQKAYGLSDQESSAFNRYNRQDIRGQDGARIIADILMRSEKQGILGVSGADFTRLPEKIQQASTLMGMQKSSGEKVDSNTAIGLLMAGQTIGGRFGDDRAGEAFGRINESIKNPDNPGMKAYMFEMLRKSNPNASYTDIQGMLENGASKENLQAVLPEISKMPQGEMRRMMLYKLTKNWQDANRLDSSNGLDAMLGSLNQGPISDKDASKKYDEANVRTERNLAAMDELGKIIKNNLIDFGEHYIARPLNDMGRGIGQGNAADMMKLISPFGWATPGGYNGNTGAYNTVTDKPQHQ